MIAEFMRCVQEGLPDWFLMENVPGCPPVQHRLYRVQEFFLNARECGCQQNRPRKFQFGYLRGYPLVIHRGKPDDVVSPCALASEGRRKNRRNWSDFCQLQGLPADFALPGMTLAARYRAVGNGVPLPMARAIATAIERQPVTPGEMVRVCVCGCAREVKSGVTLATVTCRKRMQRRRDAAAVTSLALVTPALSLNLENPCASPAPFAVEVQTPGDAGSVGGMTAGAASPSLSSSHNSARM